RFAAQQKLDEFGVDVDAVGNQFAGHFRVNENSTDGSGVTVVHAAHGIEQVGRVQNTHLHAFNHLFVSVVGVSGLEDDALGNAIEGQFAHIFQFGGNGHIDDMPFGGSKKFIHQRDVNRAERFCAL